MRKPVTNKIIYDGPLTGTVDEESEDGFKEFDPIQQTWRVHPADELDYKGTIGYKDA